ncbi:MAG: hypothetical protein R2724_19500 [Bryobacterales bacterium]
MADIEQGFISTVTILANMSLDHQAVARLSTASQNRHRRQAPQNARAVSTESRILHPDPKKV